jgi:serine phosphatase RsbU (regulator of sigma subunit)
VKTLKFKTRVALIFFTAYSILSLYLIFFFYQKTIVFQKEQLRDKLMQVSALVASSVRAEDIDAIVPAEASMGTPEYNFLVNKLRRAKEVTPDIEDIYVLVRSEDPEIMRFIANADPIDVVKSGEDFNIAPYPEMLKAFQSPSADKKITRDKWGYWLSGYAPIKHPDGRFSGILGTDISADTIAQMQTDIKNTAAYVFFIGIIMSVIAGKMASWWLAKPMIRLIEGMNDICSGNLDRKIPVKADDEFGKLSRNFNEMADKLKKYIHDLTETTKEKERLNRELEIASELQIALLPRYKIEVEGVDLAGVSLPATTVGGDYFDYMNNSGGNIGFVIADAAGKGLHGSIFMTNSKSIFKIMTTEETSPARVICRTNDHVINNVDPSSTMFVTMFYGIYDSIKRVFKYSNAGHNPPLFIEGRTNEIRLLGPHGYPIGICEKQEYGEDIINMEIGDVIVLYTDGVVEAMNGKGEMFGMERLRELCLGAKDLSSREIVENIKDKVFTFAEGTAQFDDLTLLVFRVT